MTRQESKEIRERNHSTAGNRAHRRNLRNINRRIRRQWREDLRAMGGEK